MTTTNEKAQGACDTKGFDYLTTEPDFTQSADDGKDFSTLATSFASANHSLVRADDGSMYAIRWNQAKHLPDAGAALRYLKQIGGAA